MFCWIHRSFNRLKEKTEEWTKNTRTLNMYFQVSNKNILITLLVSALVIVSDYWKLFITNNRQVVSETPFYISWKLPGISVRDCTGLEWNSKQMKMFHSNITQENTLFVNNNTNNLSLDSVNRSLVFYPWI